MELPPEIKFSIMLVVIMLVFVGMIYAVYTLHENLTLLIPIALISSFVGALIIGVADELLN